MFHLLNVLCMPTRIIILSLSCALLHAYPPLELRKLLAFTAKCMHMKLLKVNICYAQTTIVYFNAEKCLSNVIKISCFMCICLKDCKCQFCETKFKIFGYLSHLIKYTLKPRGKKSEHLSSKCIWSCGLYISRQDQMLHGWEYIKFYALRV